MCEAVKIENEGQIRPGNEDMGKQMKTSKARDYQKEQLNILEAEIAITALHATGEYTVIRKLNLERDTRFSS